MPHHYDVRFPPANYVVLSGVAWWVDVLWDRQISKIGEGGGTTVQTYSTLSPVSAFSFILIMININTRLFLSALLEENFLNISSFLNSWADLRLWRVCKASNLSTESRSVDIWTSYFQGPRPRESFLLISFWTWETALAFRSPPWIKPTLSINASHGGRLKPYEHNWRSPPAPRSHAEFCEPRISSLRVGPHDVNVPRIHHYFRWSSVVHETGHHQVSRMGRL